RVSTMEKLAVEFRVQENLSIAAQNLQSPAFVANRVEKIRSANEMQFKCASQLQELARVLRMPGDKLAVLREARDRVEQAIAKQEEVNKQTLIAEGKEVPKDPKQAAEKDPKGLEFKDLNPLPKLSAAEKAIKAAQDKA